MKEPVRFSISKRIKSFSFAFAGFSNLIKNEHNARIHLAILCIVVITGFLLHISSNEWIILTIVAGLVFITELFNTAIEKLSDIVDPEWNDSIRLIKDYSAAAVLISAIIAVIAGGLIIVPKILEILKT